MAPTTRSRSDSPLFFGSGLLPKVHKPTKKKTAATTATPAATKAATKALKVAAKDAEKAATALLGLSKSLRKQAAK
jgi:hypothetical protein